MRTQHERRRIAMWTCLLWLLGAELLPALHQADHDDQHTHAPDGSIIRLQLEQHFAAHEAGLSHHHHPTPSAKRAPRPRRPRSELPAIEHANGHAANGIAHHAVALHRPAPPLLQPLPAAPLEWRVVDVRETQVALAPLARPTARGPPGSG
ncbi:MAG: hypothetical protein ABI867_36060 [Kofleriaceae bacterium]